MNRSLLDTSADSQFLRDQRQVEHLIDGASWHGVPTVVLGELWTGFLRGCR